MKLHPTPLSIPIDTATQWIGRWEMSKHHLKALSFTFDADEFRAILEEESVVKIRLYIGLEDADGAINEKLLAVGVDAHGHDVLDPARKPKKGAGTGDPGEDGTGIYDFSHPCPPICGKQASL